MSRRISRVGCGVPPRAAQVTRRASSAYCRPLHYNWTRFSIPHDGCTRYTRTRIYKQRHAKSNPRAFFSTFIPSRIDNMGIALAFDTSTMLRGTCSIGINDQCCTLQLL